jgi:hypothetical protein
MFEEVPPVRRGLAGLLTRRAALGPFIVGGGLALVAIGGSVAVAATVFTASNGSPHNNTDLPAHPLPVVVPTPATSSATAHAAARSAAGQPASSTAARGPVSLVAGAPSWTAPVQIGASTAPIGSPQPPSGTATPTSSGPVGNALVYVTGYDRDDRQLVFQYAGLVPGAGAGGSDLYQVSSPTHYHAGLAAGLAITSGGTLCPPAGSSCSVAELIAAAPAGFFAEAAIDPSAEFESIVEVDNAGEQAGVSASPAPSGGSQALAPTGSPTAGPTG